MTSAHLATHILAVLCAMLAVGWLWQVVAALRGVPTLSDLTQETWSRADFGCRSEAADPDVTVVVPACNEGASIQATLRSLLASTGARLQIVAVNDRSTDGTGERMEEVAAEARRTSSAHTIEVVHVRELPAGWLGKAHALALGAERSKAQWLLFTDGDVRFAPQAVERALTFAEAERADHVVLALTLEFKSVAEAAVFAAFQALSSWNVQLWKVADAKAWDFFGAGGFNMVRRAVYERVGGFSALRMEVVEDLRMGWKVKRAGYAQRVVLGPGLARIRWIEGQLGIVRLLEKNGFAAMRYSIALTMLACVGFAIQVLMPLLALAYGGWASVAGAATYACIAMAYAANWRVTQVSPWTALLFALATGMLMFALARSMVLTLKRGGVLWRGTLYPLVELRRNAGGWR